ncbi:amidohydrolase family protein [Frigidibacter sp. ROC022]|uniref:amidohydrolase family protein n=1 Tax=Frigidibacter sp. ROC022 TaxID=2971796 RepID=UPI00215AC4E1|nr:amidohydrolase family protein [Frigidibacter sp. ROC022]MCR8723515.1 amidohydrolase family protein [Frigidibacter sp. ROC022]
MEPARDRAPDGPLPTRIVDAHHHLWDLGRFPYPWLAPEAPPRPFGNHDAIKRDFLIPDYLRHFDGLPLVASVHVQANCGAADPGDETAWLAELSRDSGWPAAAVGEIDLCSGTAAEVLAAHARHPLARGVRAMVAHDRTGRWRFSDRPQVMGEPGFLDNAARLMEMGFSLDLVIVPEQLPEVARLAAALPKLAIIVDHLATPEPETWSQWTSGIEAVRRFDNVAMKLSGLWTIDKPWRPDRLRPFVRHALRQLGGDRLMYGSNAPIDPLHCPVADQVRTLACLVTETHPQDLDAVFGDTASRLYRLARPAG